MEIEIQQEINQLDTQVTTTITNAIQLIHHSVFEKGEKLSSKLHHQTTYLRKHLYRPNILLSAIDHHINHNSVLYSPLREYVISHFPSSHHEMNLLHRLTPLKPFVELPEGQLEVEEYILLLVIIASLDNDKKAEALFWGRVAVERADKMHISTDSLMAKIFFYYHRSAELCNVDVTNELLIHHTTATLRQASETKATITNLIVRGYLAANKYSLCEKFITKSVIGQNVSNQQQARYYYYLGRTQCINLKYTDAYQSLTTAVRKAPQLPKAFGFHVCVNKWLTLVQLLMGEIPKRNVFLQNDMLKAMLPYYRLTHAVQIGDLEEFRKVVDEFKDWFNEDKTMGIVTRIRQNVIKTAIRKIHTSYSVIGLKDIQQKLQLESVEDTEFIVAKCIQDNVIDAVIDHEKQIVIGNNTIDIYTTNEPQVVLEGRMKNIIDLQRDIENAMIFGEVSLKINKEGAYISVDTNDSGYAEDDKNHN